MQQDVQICQPASCEQPVGILLQTAIKHFGEPEFQLDDADDMLETRAYCGFLAVPGPFSLVHHAAVAVAAVGAVARLGGPSL